MIRPFACLALVVSFAHVTGQAADPLKVGDAVPGPFRMYVANDTRFEKGNPNLRTGRMHCYICEAELNPTVAIFARTPAAADAPAIKVAKALNPLITEQKANRLGAFVAFLTLGKEYQLEDGRDAKAKQVAETAIQADAKNVPFGLAAGKSPQTDLYSLQDGHDLTIVFFDRMKVVQIWTFTADAGPDDAKLKEMAKAIADHVKK